MAGMEFLQAAEILSGFQRAELALMMKPIEEAKAKERMLSGKVDPVQNSSQGTKTRDTIADLAGVSHDTIRKVEAIKEAATPEGGFFLLDARLFLPRKTACLPCVYRSTYTLH